MLSRSSLALCVLCLILPTACKDSNDAAGVAGPTAPADRALSGMHRNELLAYAIENLNRLEEFDSAEVLRELLERLNPQDPSQAASSERPDPLMAAWPEPEMLRQIINRLNQWIHAQQPPADWRVDPMLAELPKPLAELPQVKELDRMEFSRFDGYALQETAWLRDIALWARGDSLDDLACAKSLFDWTVRNIQIEADIPGRIPLFPWESLLFGRGTATERAWVFVLLVRQLGLDAAILGIPQRQAADEDGNKEDQTQAPGGAVQPWCVAVLIDGNAYLFEPVLGLPIPASDGVTLDENGQLTIQPATLAQVVNDPRLLRQLDAGDTQPYNIKTSDLKELLIMLEASPSYLARRMTLLESRLTGAKKMVLTTSPTVQAERWKAVPHVSGARLWLWPFETLQHRSQLSWQGVQSRLAAMLPFYGMSSAPLRRGRVLQLKGQFAGDEGAVYYFQMARPSQQDLSASSAHPFEKLIYMQAKQDASYWMGLIAYQRGNYPSAIDYFTTRTLDFAPDGPWTNGARYNLARTFEASGQRDRAILLYQSNTSSPGYHGDLLRAKWLQQQGEMGKGESGTAGGQ